TTDINPLSRRQRLPFNPPQRTRSVRSFFKAAATAEISTRNRHSWVHVLPEGLVHQHPQVDLRYFKWGVARLILESEPAPDVVPMFIDGTEHVMKEER
ncbi:hypothetical protein OFL98_27185, partial [Escherichia coli]|nr:hypothetical protein [Escherichia coli]